MYIICSSGNIIKTKFSNSILSCYDKNTSNTSAIYTTTNRVPNYTRTPKAEMPLVILLCVMTDRWSGAASIIYYFASAAVTVDSSHASSSASQSRFSQPSNFVNGHLSNNVVHGLSLATITGRCLGKTPYVQVSMTWALTWPETVHQRPCMTREIKT